VAACFFFFLYLHADIGRTVFMNPQPNRPTCLLLAWCRSWQGGWEKITIPPMLSVLYSTWRWDASGPILKGMGEVFSSAFA